MWEPRVGVARFAGPCAPSCPPPFGPRRGAAPGAQRLDHEFYHLWPYLYQPSLRLQNELYHLLWSHFHRPSLRLQNEFDHLWSHFHQPSLRLQKSHFHQPSLRLQNEFCPLRFHSHQCRHYFTLSHYEDQPSLRLQLFFAYP